MDWFAAGEDGPLGAIRAIHFAASAITTGTLVFAAVAGKAVLPSGQELVVLKRKQVLWLACISLAVAIVSAIPWLLLQTASIGGRDEPLTSGLVLTVLSETQFGLVWQIRMFIALFLAACLTYGSFAQADSLALAAAIGLTAGIAWSGHAGSTTGEWGNVHLTADALHLIAAAAWIGGLACLVLLLATVRRDEPLAWESLALETTRRFSLLGTVCVATLLVTGLINSWILVGSFHALFVTEYGRLLMVKLAIVAVMLAFAATNRFWLTPRLARLSGDAVTVRQLTRNSAIEIVLGLAIFAIVGMLGMMHPAVHLM
jgi:copper resistance protein D